MFSSLANISQMHILWSCGTSLVIQLLGHLISSLKYHWRLAAQPSRRCASYLYSPFWADSVVVFQIYLT